MLNWFKKDPLIHGLTLLFAIPAALILILIGLIIYEFLTLFNPNYEEFGPNVSLYKARECAQIDKQYSVGTECFLAIGHQGMWKNNPKTLAEVVEDVANQYELHPHPNLNELMSDLIAPKPLPALINYPKKGNQWICSLKGSVVPDNKTHKVQATLYKCWPK